MTEKELIRLRRMLMKLATNPTFTKAFRAERDFTDLRDQIWKVDSAILASVDEIDSLIQKGAAQ